VRLAGWTLAGALVVLGARSLAYALAPVPTVQSIELEQAAGGPRLVVVAAVSLALALVVATAVVALAALAVRERALLERAQAPRLGLTRLAVRFCVLFVCVCTAFALFESTLHWRAGLGWHGIHCLVGPVHRDAIPLLAAHSLVAVALAAALDHLVAWARRTFARLTGVPRVRVRRGKHAFPRRVVHAPLWSAAPPSARGPPRLSAVRS
jgi:hypothetical protein